MSRQERIHSALSSAFNVTYLEVKDESHHHAGHAGARPEGETHYAVTIVSDDFEGQMRVQRHRAVNKAVAAEFEAGLHAFAITALTPAEAKN